MSDIKVCRICLRTEAKMYNYDRYQLKFYYEEVMALRVNEEEGLPHYFCYECATILHKFHKFKEKCYSGQKILKELLWRGPITYELVYKVDRNDTMLKSPLKIITDSNRVKTYTARDSREVNDIEEDGKIKEKSRHIEVEYFSDAFVEDGDTSDINYMSDNEKVPIEDIMQVDKVSIGKGEITSEENIIIDEEKLIYSHENIIGGEVIINYVEDDQKHRINKTETDIDTTNTSSSPKTVYIDIENGLVDMKDEEIKEKRTRKIYTDLKVQLLDDKNWKKMNLSEEEALKEFRAKAQNKKYLEAAFKCTDCFKGFSKNDMLMRHKLLRHAESLGKFECRFCRMRYKLDCHLRKHMKQHYTKYQCLRCSLVCQLDHSAILHEEWHSGVTRKCIYCDEEFRHMSTYYTHLRTHRSEHVCTLCGASFVSANGLRQHKKIKHVLIDIESPDDDEEVNTHCERCDIRFETRKAYEEHLFHSALHFNDRGNESKENPTKKVLGKKEQAKITKGIRKRNNDKETIKPVHGMKRNRRQKTKPTTCHQCGKHFATQAACWKHHLAEHPRTSFFSSAERYICEICGSSLAPGSVATHQNMHTREKLYTCDTCGRQFHAIIGLKRHMVTHTGEKPYACSMCDKRFTQSNSMKLHYRTFHLKQPYPKRNRRQKPEKPKDATEAGDTSSDSDSEDSLPDAEPPRQPGIEPVPSAVERPPDENMHYLTLT